jgi:hypothetical protein
VCSIASIELDVIDEIVARLWDQLVGRLSGPMSFRFVIQPAVAATLAIRAGMRDARAHRSAYLWALVTGAGDRRTMISSAWQDIGRLFAFATILDSLYQIEVLRFFYPLQALAVACVLAIVPYVAIRGLVNRVLDGYQHQSGR